MKRRNVNERERDGMCMERKNGGAYRATERGTRNAQERIKMKKEREREKNEKYKEKKRHRNNRRDESKPEKSKIIVVANERKEDREKRAKFCIFCNIKLKKKKNLIIRKKCVYIYSYKDYEMQLTYNKKIKLKYERNVC